MTNEDARGAYGLLHEQEISRAEFRAAAREAAGARPPAWTEVHAKETLERAVGSGLEVGRTCGISGEFGPRDNVMDTCADGWTT